jgi:hypothetical protein
MPGKRKLFVTHAGELAHRLVRAVKRDGLVAQFVRSYAERHNRQKLVADPDHMRLLESTIGREALLVIVVEVRRLLPRAFGTGRGSMLRPEEAALSDAFYAEFLASLGRAMEWPASEAAAEAQDFQRDLEVYGRWKERSAVSARASSVGASESPFADRCAILLDPAMMEHARRAAADFEAEVASMGVRMLGQLGRGTIRAAKKSPQRARKSPRQVKKTASRSGKSVPRKKKPALRAKPARPSRRR